MDERKQDRVVDVGHTLAAAAERHAEERSRVVELDSVHLCPDDFGDAVVSGWTRVQRTERQAFLVFVDLLWNERDVEEELRRGRGVRNIWERQERRHVPRPFLRLREVDSAFRFVRKEGPSRTEGRPILLNVGLVFTNKICWRDKSATQSSTNEAEILPVCSRN